MSDTVVISDIVEDTVVDGPGFRVAIYAAGCSHRCPGCHNPETWDITQGRTVSLNEILSVVRSFDFSGVTFTGGDPLYQPKAFTQLARHIKEETGKNIWCYTGYRYEEVVDDPHLSPILPFIDVLVDGPYVENLRDTTLLFRGSSNQRLVDVQASLRASSVVEYDYRPFAL